MRAHDMFAVAVLNRNGSHWHSTALYRGVVIGGAGGAMAPPDFGRSVNPISTRGDRLSPSNYYWHPRISRPFNGPALQLMKIYRARVYKFSKIKNRARSKSKE